MGVELAQVAGGESVKRKRIVRQRLTVAKRFAQAAAVVAAVLLVPYVAFHIGTGPMHQATANISQNKEAQRLYDLARYQFNRTPGTPSQPAINAIERAIDLDPQFIAAYVLRLEMIIWTFDLPRHDLAVKPGTSQTN
jgi:hypothetical protein